jgi:hypothetical protein
MEQIINTTAPTITNTPPNWGEYKFWNLYMLIFAIAYLIVQFLFLVLDPGKIQDIIYSSPIFSDVYFKSYTIVSLLYLLLFLILLFQWIRLYKKIRQSGYGIKYFFSAILNKLGYFRSIIYILFSITILINGFYAKIILWSLALLLVLMKLANKIFNFLEKKRANKIDWEELNTLENKDRVIAMSYRIWSILLWLAFILGGTVFVLVIPLWLAITKGYFRWINELIYTSYILVPS